MRRLRHKAEARSVLLAVTDGGRSRWGSQGVGMGARSGQMGPRASSSAQHTDRHHLQEGGDYLGWAVVKASAAMS